MRAFPPETLTPARRPAEKREDYIVRRRVMDKAIKRYLRGQMLHVSRRAILIPLAGVDAQTDELVRRGEIKVIDTVIKGKQMLRLAMPKGITYNKPSKEITT